MPNAGFYKNESGISPSKAKKIHLLLSKKIIFPQTLKIGIFLDIGELFLLTARRKI
jgi:hypothetical protein